MCGKDGRQWRARAGRQLGAFRRRPRPSLLSILSSLDSARCVVCCRFSRFPVDMPARLLGIYSGRACASRFLTVCALVGSLHAYAVPAPRTHFRRLPSSTGSFLPAFSRADRGSGHTPMVKSCRALPKYPGCVVEPQVDGRGPPGVPRRLPVEATLCEVDWHSSVVHLMLSCFCC